jgi:hypothetical protein
MIPGYRFRLFDGYVEKAEVLGFFAYAAVLPILFVIAMTRQFVFAYIRKGEHEGRRAFAGWKRHTIPRGKRLIGVFINESTASQSK